MEDQLKKLSLIEKSPDPEVRGSERRARRRLTAEYKLRILKELDLCRGDHGAQGALLRREGLYRAIVAQWRQQRESGAFAAMSVKRGRRSKISPLESEYQELKKQYARLEEKLRRAELIIDVQKKVAAMLGAPIEPTESI